MVSKLYVVIGFSDDYQNGDYYEHLQGVFSTPELAKECDTECVEADIYKYCKTEEVESELSDEPVYVVMGYRDDCDNGSYHGHFEGVFPTMEDALSHKDEYTGTGLYEYCEIEVLRIDEFGFK